MSLNVDFMTCSFCSWRAPGRPEPEAVAAWEAHMADAHPVYWAQRNAMVKALSSYERGAFKAGAGRMAQHLLAALGLTPDQTGENCPWA